MSDDVWAGVDVEELDGRDLQATVAFSAEADLAKFLDRLDKYGSATPTAKGFVVGADLFDRIETARRYGRADRLSPRLSLALSTAEPNSEHNVDIEIWHPGGPDAAEDADAWVKIVRDAVTSNDGHILDWYSNHEIGLLLLRIRATTELVDGLADLDEIASMDLKPQPPDALVSVGDLGIDDLPSVTGPQTDAPLFAIVDSGVSGAHPLISPALYEATTLLPELPDGSDAHGHGTAVAGLALHGRAEEFLFETAITPHARLLSLRVLDDRNGFPDERLWARAVLDAIDHAAERGCVVVNLSIGDSEGAMTDRRATRVAALVDSLVRRRGLVVVVPTGNISDLRDYVQPSPFASEDYVKESLKSPATTLLDPAPAALALTVGGLGQSGALKLGERAVGQDTQPSAISRRGPGVARGIKPEVAAAAGTMAWVDTFGFVTRPSLRPVVLSHQADDLFTRAHGTSYAAPLVTRVATAIQAQYPGMSGPLIRALVLQACSALGEVDDLLPEGTPAVRERLRLNLVGHGTPDLNRARFSQRDRVVLVAEGTLQVDKVVVYEVPLPESFFERGGTRTIDLSVCFDPLTRYRRKDYLGSRVFPYVFLGHEAEEIVEALAEADVEELEKGEDEGAAVTHLKDLRRVDFRPSTAMSSDSANILMRAVRPTRYDPDIEPVAHLAIRSTARWSPTDTEDPIGIALAIGHEQSGLDIYEELRARIDIEIDQEVEIDLETQPAD